MRDKEILGLWEAYNQVHAHQEEVEQLDEISKRLASDVVLARIGQTGAAHNREMKNRTRENMMASQEAGRKEARAKRLAAGVRKRRNANEEFETWINALVEEGYDLSEYTWDDMYEIYMEEVEQLDEDAPERITKPSRNKRLMKDAGPARVHNPKKVEEEFEQLDEDAKYDRNRKRAAQRAAARNEARKQGKTGSVPGVGYVSPRPERETYRDSAGVERHKSGAKMPQKEEVDLFDAILEHLVFEGYADTNEAALAIMANMSGEWRESIVEELEQLDEISLKTKMKAFAATQDPEADYQYGSKVHAQGDRIRKAIVKKHGEKAGEHADAHADSEHWGRTDKRTGKRQGYAKPRIEKNRTYRTTKAGKMHGQDQSTLKSDLKKRRNRG